MHNIINLRKQFNSRNDFYEFMAETINLNINKMNYPQIVLMVLNIGLLLVDIFVYRSLWSDFRGYKYLFFSHIIIILTNICWLIYFYKLKDKLSNLYNGVIFVLFCNIIIYWCVFMNVVLFENNKQVSAYIIVCFTISAIFYMVPLVSIILQLLSYFVIVIALMIVSNNNIGIYNLVNLTFTLVFSNVVSITIFNHYLKDYMNKKKLLESNKKLEKLNEEKIQFLANVSHELKTPLNIIYTAQQMLKISTEAETYNKDNINKYMKLMKQNTNRLSRLIDNLLDLTKIDARSFKINKKNVDIVKIVEDITLSSVDFIENKGITVTFDTEEEELILACDPDSIERIVLNLLSNAVKFTNNGGNIFVEVKSNKDTVSIVVKDTGIGINSIMKEEIFERFVQVDKSIRRTNEGTGIGLALVESLVELHHGNIELYTELNVGSIFIVNLPRIVLEDEMIENKNILNDRNIERIAIEFSDIYEVN